MLKLTIVCWSLLAYTTWQIYTTLSLNHIPIVVNIDKHSDFLEPDKHTFFNKNKANWEGFRAFIEENTELISLSNMLQKLWIPKNRSNCGNPLYPRRQN